VLLTGNKKNRPKPIAMATHRASKAPGAALLIRAFAPSCRCPEPLGWVFNRLLSGRWRRLFMDTFGKYTTGCGIQNKWYKIQCKTPIEANAVSEFVQAQVLPGGPDLSFPQDCLRLLCFSSARQLRAVSTICRRFASPVL
jgi:hypothetical protein